MQHSDVANIIAFCEDLPEGQGNEMIYEVESHKLIIRVSYCQVLANDPIVDSMIWQAQNSLIISICKNLCRNLCRNLCTVN